MNLEKGFNPENLKQVREYLNKKFAEMREEMGVNFSLGTMTFENNEFRATLTANIGSPEDAAKKEWDKYCSMFGLRPEWFGKEFTAQGKVYTICGIKKYASDRSVVASNDGKEYLFRHMAIIPKFLTQTDKFEVK